MKDYFTKNGYLAVSAPEFKKVEQKIVNGFATISQRTDMTEVDLIMDYVLNGERLYAGSYKIILRGDAGLQKWAKEKYYLDGKEFVLCPEGSIIGYSHEYSTESYEVKP